MEIDIDRPEGDASIARIAGRKSGTLVPVARAPRKREDAPNLIHDLVSYTLNEHLIGKPHSKLKAIRLSIVASSSFAVFVLLFLPLLCDCASVTTSTWIILVTIFISYLATRLSSSVLSC